MDFKQIQDLIKLVNDSNIGEVTIEQKDFKVTIKQKEEHAPQMVTSMPSMQYALPQAQYAPQQSMLSGNTNQQAQNETTTTTTPSNTVTIKSPMIGTFYKKPSPDKPNFVEVGDEVSVGKVVCIIEAMKLFNEIESEVSGKIIKILVDDASPVEYDQPLYLVEPS